MIRFLMAIFLFFLATSQAWSGGYFSPGMRGANGGLVATSLCPKGTGLGDGCSLANINSAVQHSTFFTGYANQSGQTYGTGGSNRPPWNVAGVDYPVGHYTATASLLDPKTSQPSGCTYSDTAGPGGGPRLLCGMSTAMTVSGYNFGPVGGHGCTELQLASSAGATLTVTNNLFAADNSCYAGTVNTIIQATRSVTFNLVFTYNTVDGCATTDTYCASATTACGCDLISDLKAGTSTYSYNAFLNSPGRIINGGCCTSYAYNNYIEGMSVNGHGHHGEFIEYTSNQYSNGKNISLIYSYNTCLLTSTQSQNGTTACFYPSPGGQAIDTGSVGPSSTSMTITAATGLYGFYVGDYVASGNSLPDLTTIVSINSGTGGVGTYTLSNSATLSAGSTIMGNLEFSTLQIDHNVMVGNLNAGVNVGSAGVEFGGAIYSAPTMSYNYFDRTGLLNNGFVYYNTSCQTPGVFTGNVDLVSGGSLNSASNSGTNLNC